LESAAEHTIVIVWHATNTFRGFNPSSNSQNS
jgi:hypothetical protein